MTSRQHKFEYEQLVEVNDKASQKYGIVQVVAKLPAAFCMTHQAPMYGCTAGDDHYTFCEDVLSPLTTEHKRKLN